MSVFYSIFPLIKKKCLNLLEIILYAQLFFLPIRINCEISSEGTTRVQCLFTLILREHHLFLFL